MLSFYTETDTLRIKPCHGMTCEKAGFLSPTENILLRLRLIDVDRCLEIIKRQIVFAA
jgi:hypothetical protein